MPFESLYKEMLVAYVLIHISKWSATQDNHHQHQWHKTVPCLERHRSSFLSYSTCRFVFSLVRPHTDTVLLYCLLHFTANKMTKGLSDLSIKRWYKQTKKEQKHLIVSDLVTKDNCLAGHQLQNGYHCQQQCQCCWSPGNQLHATQCQLILLFVFISKNQSLWQSGQLPSISHQKSTKKE